MRLVLGCLLLAAACGRDSSSTADGNPGGGDGSNLGDGGGGDGRGPGGTTVSITIPNHPSHPAGFTFLAAYQDGAGAWQLAPAASGDVYSFDIQSAAWGFAYTCIANIGGIGTATEARVVIEVHFAVGERTALTLGLPPRCTDRNPMNVALTGTITNVNGGGLYLVSFGGRTTIASGQGTFAMETPPGTHDLIVQHVIATGGNTGEFLTDRVIVRRGVAVTSATAVAVNADNAVAPQDFPVIAVSAGRVTATTLLYSAGGTDPTIVRSSNPLVTQSFDASQMASGDVYDQQIQVAGNGQTAITTNATATPASETFSAPAPLGGATSTVPTSMPYPAIHTSWAEYANAIGYDWAAVQALPAAQCGGQTACTITWAAALSPGVTGGSPSYTMPDLSQLPGWSAKLELQPGTMVAGTVQAMTSSAGAMDFPAGIPAAGTQRMFVRSDYTVTP